MTEEARKRLITWGVNGYGARYFLCRVCLEEFGYVDYWAISHYCKGQSHDK
jgi:hypothetical protein